MFKTEKWSKIRAGGQIVFWLLFIAILINTRDPINDPFIYNLLPRLSIHLGLATSLAAGKLLDSFFLSFIVIGLTLLLGRFFCGWICPMGITIDATDRIFNRGKKNCFTGRGGKRNIKPYKFIVLILSLAVALGGVHVAGIIDPLSLIFRTYSSVLYPYFDSSTKYLFTQLYGVPVVNSVTEPVYSLLKSHILDYRNIMFLGHLKLFFFFLAIIALSFFARRFWCQSLCPLGASLSLFSRVASFRRGVDGEKCTNCLRCERECRMNAIYRGGEGTYEGECIKCFECLKSCEFDAVSFGFCNPFLKKPAGHLDNTSGKERKETGPDISRRGLIYSIVSSAIAIPLLKMKPGYARDHAHLIRPPGALPEEKFLDRCIRCNECMKVCPTNALHPTIFEGGPEGIFTPRLIPRLGYCEKNCVLCTQICPTDAIKELKIADKETTIFGTAYFIRDLCIPWSEQINCIVCEEVCPTRTKAIRFRESVVLNKDGKRVRVKHPYVIERLCIGCGVCENKCPVPGSGGIRVRTPKLPAGEIQVDRFGGYK